MTYKYTTQALLVDTPTCLTIVPILLLTPHLFQMTCLGFQSSLTRRTIFLRAIFCLFDYSGELQTISLQVFEELKSDARC